MTDSDATARLAGHFDAHAARLYRLARRLSSNSEEARDLVQETFLRAAHHPQRLPAEAAAGEAWLVRTLVNLCRDRWRRQEVRRRRTESPAMPAIQNPETTAATRELVSAALALLSPRRRAVTVLRYLEDRDTKDIARVLGISQVTVRWHLAAARQQLRRHMGDISRKPS